MGKLVETQGLFWKRSWIDRDNAKLWCKRAKGNRKMKKTADVWDMPGIYILYSSNYEPIYVGQSGKDGQNLGGRLMQHTEDHLMHQWEYFSWYGILDVTKNNPPFRPFKKKGSYKLQRVDVLSELERILIDSIRPRYNISRGRGPPILFIQINKDDDQVKYYKPPYIEEEEEVEGDEE